MLVFIVVVIVTQMNVVNVEKKNTENTFYIRSKIRLTFYVCWIKMVNWWWWNSTNLKWKEKQKKTIVVHWKWCEICADQIKFHVNTEIRFFCCCCCSVWNEISQCKCYAFVSISDALSLFHHFPFILKPKKSMNFYFLRILKFLVGKFQWENYTALTHSMSFYPQKNW